MDLGIKGRIAIITGASKGIGKAIALGLAKEEALLCLVARTPSTLEALRHLIAEEFGVPVMAIAGDVADPRLPTKVMSAVLKVYGDIDILVNNVGGPPPGTFLEHSEQVWDQALEKNLKSVIRFTRAVLPHMIKHKWGRIINISSTTAKEPSPQMILSATARAAVSAFSKAISQEVAEKNITINTICPGGVLTDRLIDLVKNNPQAQDKSLDQLLKEITNTIPAKRFADPVEIADLALFLASERSAYITGTNIAADGALTKSIF